MLSSVLSGYKPLDIKSSDIKSSTPGATAEIEIEVRFRHIVPSSGPEGVKLAPGVTYNMYNRVVKALTAASYPVTEEESEVAIEKDTRRISIGNQTRWERKITEARFESDYAFNLVVAREVPVTQPYLFKPEFIRSRERKTFLLLDGKVKVDCTIIVGNTQGSFSTTYEVEAEYHGSTDPEAVKQADETISMLYCLLHDTKLPYTVADYKTMITFFNTGMGGRAGNLMFDSQTVSKARNIKFPDLTLGSIVGNKQTAYTVAVKADGKRKFLVHTNGQLWSIDSSSSNLLTVKTTEVKPFILETEDVETSFLAYDCLFYSVPAKEIAYFNKDKQITRYNLTRQAVIDIRKAGLLSDDVIVHKGCYLLTAKNFFNVLEQVLDSAVDLPYGNDGLIFTPADTSYRSKYEGVYVDTMDVHRRFLSTYPDICKWKPVVTIDFVVKNNKLYSWGNKELVLFTGTRQHPYNGTVQDLDVLGVSGVSEGTVVEFEYRDGKFIPTRIRDDKPVPNGVAIAEANWKDICEPIEKDDLLGKNIRLVRKYHNKLKTDLLKKLKPGSIILDIGGGRGGDISKWEKINAGKVYSIEPNEDNASHFIQRLSESRFKDKVSLLIAGGEETQSIVNFIEEKVDAVTLMLSASFFWKSPDMLKALVKTIVSSLAPGGKVVILTIDGDAVMEMFQPSFTDSQYTQCEVAQTTITLKPDEETLGREIEIVIPGTIVETQTEYCVHTSDLTNLLSAHGYRCDGWTRATNIGLATDDQKLFTSLYSYGTYTAPGSTTLESKTKSVSRFQRKEEQNLQRQTSPTQTQKKETSKIPFNAPKNSKTIPSPKPNPSSSLNVPSLRSDTSRPVHSTGVSSTPKEVLDSIPSIGPKASSSSSSSSSSDFNDNDERQALENMNMRSAAVKLNVPNVGELWKPLNSVLKRKATINGENSLLHAIVYCIDPMYRSGSKADRIKRAVLYRNTIAKSISKPYSTDYSIWEVAMMGEYPTKAIDQLLNNQEMVDSAEGIEQFLEGNGTITIHLAGLLAMFFKLNLYVFHQRGGNLTPLMSTPFVERYKSVFLLAFDSHFEVIGTNEETCLFSSSSSLVRWGKKYFRQTSYEESNIAAFAAQHIYNNYGDICQTDLDELIPAEEQSVYTFYQKIKPSIKNLC